MAYGSRNRDEGTPLNLEDLAGPEDPSLWSRLLAPISAIGTVLDTPGSVVRGLVAGEPGRALEGIFDPEQRVSGQEILTKAGWEEPGIGKTLTGLGLDVLLDPLLPLSFGTKAGAAVKAIKEVGADIRVYEKMALLGDKAAQEILPVLTSRKDKLVSALRDTSLLDIEGRVGKAEAGAWGLEYAGKPITPVNRLLAKGADKVEAGYGALKETAVVGPTLEAGTDLFKKIFSTTLPGEGGKIRDAVDASIEKSGFALKEWQISAEERGRTLIKDTSFKDLDEFKEALSGSLQLDAIPARLDAHLAEQSAIWTEEASQSLEKIDSQIAALRAKPTDPLPSRKKIPFDDRAGIELTDAEKAMNLRADQMDKLIGQREKILGGVRDKIEDLTYRYDGVKQELSSKFEMINRYGDLPSKFNQELVDAGMRENIWFEQGLGLPAVRSSEKFVDYLEHSKSAVGRALFQANPELEAKYYRVFADQAGFLQRRSKDVRNLTIEEINEKIFKETGVAGAFETDPIANLAARRLDSEVSVARVRGLTAAIGLDARPMSQVADPITGKLAYQASPGMISVKEIVEKQGLTGMMDPKDGAFLSFKHPVTGTIELEKGLSRIGLADKQISREMYDALTKVETFSLPAGVEKFAREVIDPINGVFRALLTSIPGFTGQNIISNSWVNWMAGVKPSFYRQAAEELAAYHFVHNPESPLKSFFGKIGTEYNAKELADATAYASLKKNVVGETRVMLAPERVSLLSPDQNLAVAGIVRVAEKGVKKVPGLAAYGQGMLDINQFAEETAKYAHYLSKRAEGLDPLSAGQSVKKYLFDYSDLTSFEKKVMKRGVLFYTFLRKNLPFAVQESLLNKKAYIAQRVIEKSRTAEYVPSYMDGTSTVQIPGTEGTFLNVKNPLFEGNFLGAEGPQRSADKVANLLSPVAKLPLELFAGRNFYTGKDSTPAETALSALPTGRFTNLASSLSEGGTTALTALVGQTGAKLSIVDQEKAKFAALRERLRAKIQATGEAATYKEFRYTTDHPSTTVQELLKGMRQANKQYSALFENGK